MKEHGPIAEAIRRDGGSPVIGAYWTPHYLQDAVMSIRISSSEERT